VSTLDSNFQRSAAGPKSCAAEELSRLSPGSSQVLFSLFFKKQALNSAPLSQAAKKVTRLSPFRSQALFVLFLMRSTFCPKASCRQRRRVCLFKTSSQVKRFFPIKYNFALSFIFNLPKSTIKAPPYGAASSWRARKTGQAKVAGPSSVLTTANQQGDAAGFGATWARHGPCTRTAP